MGGRTRNVHHTRCWERAHRSNVGTQAQPRSEMFSLYTLPACRAVARFEAPSTYRAVRRSNKDVSEGSQSRREPFITDPRHLAALAGSSYLVLRPPDDMTAAFTEA